MGAAWHGPRHGTRAVTLLVGLLIALGGAPGAGRADTLFEVERARALARSGMPVDRYDQELLDRWGALSGTPPRDVRAKRTTQDRHSKKRPRARTR